MSPRLLPALTGLLAALLFAADLRAQAPSLSAAEPDSGTEGTEFLVSGADLGTKQPKLFLTQQGAKVPKTRLKVLGFADSEGGDEQQLLVRVQRAVAGEFQLAVKVKGKLTVVSDVVFTVVPPTITALDDFFPGGPDAFELELENATKKGLQIRFGGKRAKLLDFSSTGDTTSTAIVRVKDLPEGLWDVNLRTRVGQDVLHQAYEVAGPVQTKFPPRAVQWSADGPPVRSKGGNTNEQLFGGTLRFTGKTKLGGDSLRVVVELPESAVTNFSGPTVLGGPTGRLVFVLTPADGGPSSIYLSSASAGPEVHSVFLNAVSDTRVAGSFFGTLEKVTDTDPGPDELFVEGSFTAEIPPPPPLTTF